MEKLIFNDLTIELTRRCNMACGHCLRGDTENVDLTGMDIDSVLDQEDSSIFNPNDIISRGELVDLINTVLEQY